MSLYTKIQNIFRSPKLHEFIRFAIVGTIATGIHYGIYLFLLWSYDIEQTETTYADIAYSIGYILSFLCNMWLTAHFTFREKLTVKRGGGFALSHIINANQQLRQPQTVFAFKLILCVIFIKNSCSKTCISR